MDPSQYRPPCPEVHCSKCNKKADKAESTAMHFGMPPTRYGILLIRVNCHQEQQDIACTFKWLESNKGKRIDAFAPVTHDYGLRDLTELDGFSLPTSIEQCAYQIQDRSKSIALNQKSLIDARFLRALELECLLHENSIRGRTVHVNCDDAIKSVRMSAEALCSAISRSKSEPVATARIVEMSANLAWTAMVMFQTLGTPVQRPDKFIDEALPNPARGTEYDLPMKSDAIQIRPQVPALSGLNPIDFDYIGRKVKAEIKNTGNLDTRAEITANTLLVTFGLEKEDRLEIIFGLESQQIAHWPLNYDGHDWITVGDIIESAKNHQLVKA